MTQQDLTDSGAGVPRRLQVELFIVHPTLAPTEISAALGLEADFAHRVGDPRRTPKGTSLSGNYRDTRWRYCVECNLTDQWYAAEVAKLLDYLGPHQEFFANLRSTGGKASVIIVFFGDAYLSDEIPLSTLAKLVDLEIALAIECFGD